MCLWEREREGEGKQTHGRRGDEGAVLEALRMPTAAAVEGVAAPPVLAVLRALGVGLVIPSPLAVAPAVVTDPVDGGPPQQHVDRSRSRAVEGFASKLMVCPTGLTLLPVPSWTLLSISLLLISLERGDGRS